VIRANLNMVTDEVLSESSAFITSHAACCTAPQGVTLDASEDQADGGLTSRASGVEAAVLAHVAGVGGRRGRRGGGSRGRRIPSHRSSFAF
jgi:hypothetical protein